MRSKTSWILILVVVFFLFTVGLTRQGSSAARTQWEYKILDVSIQDQLNEKILNELGAQGWELVQAQNHDDSPYGGIYIFKRAK